jgi:hypothetical protein
MTRLPLIFWVLVLLPCSASAKRIAPVKVEPVTYKGIRYVAPNDDSRRGYIQAWDVTTNKKLWELTVFINRINPKLEEDVQWVFIRALTVQDGRLMVTSEDGTAYQIELKTKAITQSDRRLSPSLKPAGQFTIFPRRSKAPLGMARFLKTMTSRFTWTHSICVETLMATARLT